MTPPVATAEHTAEVELIYNDPREIQSIWYHHEDGHGFSTNPDWDGSTSKIVAYPENGQMSSVPFYAVFDNSGQLKVRVPATMVTVIYKTEAQS